MEILLKPIQSNNIKITVDNQSIGINEHSTKKILVYPNPSSGKIFIEVPETSDEVNLKVMNLQGQIIWEEKLNIFGKTEINIKNPGIYNNDKYKNRKLFSKSCSSLTH